MVYVHKVNAGTCEILHKEIKIEYFFLYEYCHEDPCSWDLQL